jgi:hypothetical protein
MFLFSMVGFNLILASFRPSILFLSVSKTGVFHAVPVVEEKLFKKNNHRAVLLEKL